jgi:acetoacetyl-CoA synthetase
VTTGDVLWRPTPESLERMQLAGYLRWLGDEKGRVFERYRDLWEWSVGDLEGFWRSIFEYFEVVAEGDPAEVLTAADMPGAQWFPDVRLNYAENALVGPDDETVLIAVSQSRHDIEMTRGELRSVVARAAASLRRLGVGPGDRVAGYLPNIPEAVIALLATASLGAIWAVCAPELGMRSVLDRLRQVRPKVLIAVDGYMYGDKAIDRREEVRAISSALPTLEASVLVPYLGGERSPGELSWADLVSEPAEPSYLKVPFGTPLWVLFSSGTTGLPKAIVHSHGGIVIEQLKSHALQSDTGRGDRYFVYCTTTWVMWNLLVSGLLVGATVVLMDGNPSYPDRAELWRVVAETGTTVFGCGAAFLIGCRQQGQTPGTQFDLSRLRHVLSTGSPLPADGFAWVYEAVSPTVFLQSGSGGTDVCTGFVGGSPWLPVRAGEIACCLLGVDAVAFDEDGLPVVGELGELVIRKPMPSMPVCFWDDPDGQRYRAAYFEKYPGYWRHGDWVKFLESGSCVITGRSDGTLNRGGVRLGTSEFYSALRDLDDVLDSLVVHVEDASALGQLILFVETRDGSDLDAGARDRIVASLRSSLSPRHVPDQIVTVPAIPYNLTGKKLEVPVKKLLQGVPRQQVLSDGAVRDPAVLDAFEAFAASIRTSEPK